MMSYEELQSYMEEITGLEVPILSSETTLSIEPGETVREIKNIIDQAYYHLIEDLDYYNMTQVKHVSASQLYRKKELSRRKFDEVTKQSREAEFQAKEATEILLRPGIETLSTFNNERNHVIKKNQDKFLAQYKGK